MYFIFNVTNCIFFHLVFDFRQQEEYLRRTLDYSEDSTQPASANSSVCEGPTSPLIVDNTLNSMEADAKHSQEVESLKRLLQEVCFVCTVHNKIKWKSKWMKNKNQINELCFVLVFVFFSENRHQNKKKKLNDIKILTESEYCIYLLLLQHKAVNTNNNQFCCCSVFYFSCKILLHCSCCFISN